MKRLVAGLCLSAVLLAGCQSTGDVRARLVSKTSGKPIAGAVVKLPSGTVTTGADGSFNATGINLGEVQASIEASGFEPFRAILTVAKSGTATATVELQDASVQLKVKEVAVEPAAVEGAIVHVGEATAAVLPDGSFEIQGVPSGPTTVTVEAASHETSTGVFVLVAGANAETMSLSLTPKATYQRYYDAYSFRRYKAAYKYLHHDLLKKESYKTFVKDMDFGTAISLKMGAQRVLKSWRSRVTKRTYHSVVEIDRAYVYEWFGRKYTEKISQHWVKVKGIWYIVWDLT
jgi:hypothetical protein